MKQLYQDPKSGDVLVADLPDPALRPGTLLVRNACSVISPGTERAMVSRARSSYLTTARARPDLVRKVLDTVQREGIAAAYQKVKAKMSEPVALGYSSAGTVVAVAEDAGDWFRVGDRVACAGQGIASHAEVVCVPVNLAARIPDGVSFEAAAFSTLGAIALHGVRTADLRLGERAAVIGCGLLGLLTVQLLRAQGVRCAAFDLDRDLAARAAALGAEIGLPGGVDDQVHAALSWTEGLGVDAVLVTAASPNDGPMVAAAGMARERARIVAVGLVPFGLPREIAYMKELELRISRSYGPGRYDLAFEEKGQDYPPAYVRWTETRNLEAFLELLRDGKVDVASIVTHRYALEQAPAAYDALTSATAPRPLGIVVRYPEREREQAPRSVRRAAAPAVEGEVGVAFLGAGAFARGVLLPRFKAERGLALRRVVTAHGLTAEDARTRFGFQEIGTDPGEVFADPAIALVCIATRHDSHAALTAAALRAGKHVFVEKPLALTEAQLRQVEEALAASSGLLMVGFNRRFAPMARAVREAFAGRGPRSVVSRVNAGALPAGHWTLDADIGGGRIIGEGCHFLDLASYLAEDARIEAVEARGIGPRRTRLEDAAIQLAFADGSVAQIVYVAGGASSLGKERVEVHGGGLSAVIDDWKEGTLHRGAKKARLGPAGKGHAEEIEALLAAVRTGGPAPIAPETLLSVTRATFRVHAVLAGSAA
ncbi:MAG TPA: bi-domain-containing oxidoreductase [Candidatus Polarisedimenticolaceae bacterium]|nr:bi-domain-containing oxidoreductase [Candidatus Polarisedimenticolaceae bacterium]